MAYALKIPQADIAKIQIVRAQNKFESLASVKKRTGANVIFNGGFYSMSTGAPESWLVVDGKELATGYCGYGYGIVDTKTTFGYQNNVGGTYFIGAVGLLVKDGKRNITNPFNDNRGRTAMGLNAAGDLIVYVIPDVSGQPKCTTSALADKMLSLGCENAINLDGGHSSQIYCSNGEYDSGRPISWWICIWAKDAFTDSTATSSLSASTNSYPVLKQGSKGKEVEALQQLLGITVDGSFGPATSTAVKTFQASKGLAVDGSVGPATWAALESIKVATPQNESNILSTLLVTKMFAPIRPSGCRPGKALGTFLGVTIHNTGNSSNGAGAIAHGNYLQGNGSAVQASWHYVVDDTAIIQSVPEDEIAWHAGDGTGKGNYNTIAIEICVNPESNLTKATDSAAWLAADILSRHGITTTSGHLFQHHYWSGKNCPQLIRAGKPYNWETFVNKVEAVLKRTSWMNEDRKKVQGRFGFDDGTMKYLDGHPLPDMLYKKLAESK